MERSVAAAVATEPPPAAGLVRGGRLAGLWGGATAALVAIAAPCHAQSSEVSVTTRGGIYTDDDATEVITGVVAADGKALEVARLRAYYLVDLVSTASVDVVSAATERWDERRDELGASAGYDDETRALGVGYRRSIEKDWDSHTFSLAGSHGFANKNLTLGASLAYTDNDVGRADSPNFAEQLRAYTGSLSAVTVLSRDDLLSTTYFASYLDGYQASPYRFVRYFDSLASAEVSAPEAVPEKRLRHALVLQYNRHLLTDSALRSHLRGYYDNWGILSGTLGTEYVHGIGGFEPSLFVRGYVQSAATFYEDGYETRRRYMTADRELSPFWDVFGGTRLAYRAAHVGIFRELFAELKLTGFWFVFEDFERLPERRGVIGEIGLGGTL